VGCTIPKNPCEAGREFFGGDADAVHEVVATTEPWQQRRTLLYAGDV